MYKKGGVSLFFIGSTATILRDLTFGGVFSLMRHELTHKKKISRTETFLIDLFSASTATILSAPLNYVRNMQFAANPEDVPQSISQHLRSLWVDCFNEKDILVRAKILQRKLRIGWGTARVGCGMAFGSAVYSFVSTLSLSSWNDNLV